MKRYNTLHFYIKLRLSKHYKCNTNVIVYNKTLLLYLATFIYYPILYYPILYYSTTLLHHTPQSVPLTVFQLFSNYFFLQHLSIEVSSTSVYYLCDHGSSRSTSTHYLIYQFLTILLLKCASYQVHLSL